MIAQIWILIVFAIMVIFTSVAFASPFDSFENELKEYIESESEQYYEGNNKDDSQIKELFSADENGEDSSRSVGTYSRVSSNYKLPSHIAIARIISTTVVRAPKKVEGYKVKHKDTLTIIAKKYGMKVDKLKKMNGLRKDLIRVGQVLRINNNSTKQTEFAGDRKSVV